MYVKSKKMIFNQNDIMMELFKEYDKFHISSDSEGNNMTLLYTCGNVEINISNDINIFDDDIESFYEYDNIYLHRNDDNSISHGPIVIDFTKEQIDIFWNICELWNSCQMLCMWWIEKNQFDFVNVCITSIGNFMRYDEYDRTFSLRNLEHICGEFEGMDEELFKEVEFHLNSFRYDEEGNIWEYDGSIECIKKIYFSYFDRMYHPRKKSAMSVVTKN